MSFRRNITVHPGDSPGQMIKRNGILKRPTHKQLLAYQHVWGSTETSYQGNLTFTPSQKHRNAHPLPTLTTNPMRNSSHLLLLATAAFLGGASMFDLSSRISCPRREVILNDEDENGNIILPPPSSPSKGELAAIEKAALQRKKKAARKALEELNRKWVPFFFESNQFFDTLRSYKDWLRLKEAYSAMSDTELLAAKEATYGGNRSVEERERKPNYGFRWEHDGSRTLADFFHSNGMVLPL